MTRDTAEVRIDAAKEKVWDVIADLGAVSVWNPALASSHYTSEANEGLEASRHCDFPDGGYVEENVIEWNPGKAVTLEISEGTVPYDSATGTLSVVEDGDGSLVTFAFEYDLSADAHLDPQEVARENREEFLPLLLAGLKQYVETGEPMTVLGASPPTVA